MMLSIFLLYGICLLPCASKYHKFVDQNLTWTEAQKYCRKYHTDLATITSQEALQALTRPSSSSGPAWIGLSDDPASWKKAMTADSNSWRWTATGTTSPGGFHIWKDTEPNYVDGLQTCGAHSLGAWMDYYCSNKYRFVCYTGSTEKQYFLVTAPSTWHEALAFCRANDTDLAMIESEAENQKVISLIGTYRYAWIGLYREPWRWSDNTPVQFTNWAPRSPNNNKEAEHCTAELATHAWDDMDCALTLPFICNTELRATTTVKMTLSAGVDLSDSTINKQILQQIGEKLCHLGITDIKWTVIPRKK